MYECIRDKPYFVPEDYLTRFNAPCIPEKPKLGLKMECKGTGILAENHPLKSHINFGNCGSCNNRQVKVIYAHWTVSPHSGDSYWDYEIFCKVCNKFTTRSFSEN